MSGIHSELILCKVRNGDMFSCEHSVYPAPAEEAVFFQVQVSEISAKD